MYVSERTQIPRCLCYYQYGGIMHYYAAGIMEYFSHYWRLPPPCHRIYTICFFFFNIFAFSLNFLSIFYQHFYSVLG